MELGRIIAPGGWRETILTMIGGYIDGSNLHTGPNVDVIAVAGCAANVDLWPRWQEKWKELLDFSDQARWHHTDFMAKKRKRKGSKTWDIWPEAEWLLARGMLCEAFETINPNWIGAAVRRSDYEEMRAKHSHLPNDPYYFLLDRCMWRLIQGMFEHPLDTGVAVYCDQDKNEEFVKTMGRWHTDFLHAKPHYFHEEVATRKVVTSYGSNTDYVPLQAADVVAHELMSFARRNVDMPFIATNIDSGSFIIERLKNKMPIMAQVLTKQMLEMELDRKAYVGDPGFLFVEPREG